MFTIFYLKMILLTMCTIATTLSFSLNQISGLLFLSESTSRHLFLRNHLNNLVGLAVYFYCTIWTLLKLSDPRYLEILFSLLMEITAIGMDSLTPGNCPHRQLWEARPVKEAKVSQSTPTRIGEDPLIELH